MKKKRLVYNMVSSLIYQIVNIICGFILPRLILFHFGTELNGLVSSISQFLSFISLMELGMGAVVQSSLYKPLAENNVNEISAILKSARFFFHKIIVILLVYVFFLCIILPKMSNNNFSRSYTTTLILIISIGTFIQYAFGMVDRLLLLASQRGYIIYISQILSIISNTIMCAILIYFGACIHVVKFISSLIFLISPLVIHIYIKNKYCINYKIQYIGEPIKQKWYGIAQHIALVVLEDTDIIVLTIFSTLSNVSIYSVYNLVVRGVKTLTISLTNGIDALLGELWAKNKIQKLRQVFTYIEWIIHTCTIFVFGCTAVLIVPFVKVYTNGINDANYIVPLFGLLLTLAYAGRCFRVPYNLIILVGGHYKQTQRCYIIAALINIILSIILVKRYGLVGVGIGTFTALFYQTIWMANYISKNLICWPIKNFIKQILVDLLTFILAYICTIWLPLKEPNFVSWLELAIFVAFVWMIIVFIVNFIFYRKNINKFFFKLLKGKKIIK